MKNFKVIFLVLMIVVFGCSKKATSTESKEVPKGKVLIEVGDTKITDTDIKEEMENLPDQLKHVVNTKDGKKEFIDSIVKREVVYLEALKEGFDKDEKVTKDLEKLKKRLVIDAYLRKKVLSETKVDDKALKEYYEKNKKEFTEADKTHSKHILVKDKKLADELYEKLKKDPSKFESFAQEYSVDSSGKQGGDIGSHEKGTLVPEYESALEKLKNPGDISPVVKSQFGYHIIKLVNREKGKTPSFEEIKDELKDAYLRENQRKVFDKLLEDIKKKYPIKISEELFPEKQNEPKEKEKK
ncbi:MAG: peptidyl-prolyl cis-trans isomerase [Proteobacteria bacterium]|nr:peptidyl-prolyl cis-trans isomerase [Pseudomonadota bacterium]